MSNGQAQGHAAATGRHTVGAHYDSLEQEYSSSKLGMWLFLATEILLFAGLFCAYAVLRSSHPELFAWGSHFLDRKMGGLNTVILIASSFTFAWAVRAAQLGQRKLLISLLFLTLLGGAGFLTVKFFEYKPKVEHGLLWGPLYHPDPHYVAEHFGVEFEDAEHDGEEAAGAHVGDAVAGEQLFQSTCAACHGRRGEGIAKQGLPLRTSTFVKERDDQALLAFIKIGRQPFDPANTTGVGMPPRGGNPIFTDDKILDTIAYVRVLQEEAASEAPSDSAAATIEAGEASGAAAEEEGFWIPKSVVPRAAVGPSGIAPVEPAVVHHQLVQEAGHQFFGIYFLLTGLHGLHVIIGMIVIGWLLVRAIRGDFGVNYFGPVDLGGLYWHLVDVIWIFLFPLLYLI